MFINLQKYFRNNKIVKQIYNRFSNWKIFTNEFTLVYERTYTMPAYIEDPFENTIQVFSERCRAFGTLTIKRNSHSNYRRT